MTNTLRRFAFPSISCALLTLIIVGYSTMTNTLDVKLLIIIGVGLLTLVFLLKSEKSRWILFCTGIFSISFGYRSIHVGYYTYILPFEIIVVALWSILLISNSGKDAHSSIPRILILVVGWSMLYGIVSLLTGARWDDVLSWTLPLVLGVPIFWVTSRLVKDINRIEIINRLFLAVAAFMSVCEIVEYFLPGIASLFPWFFHPLPLITTDGFVRGTFSFWGYPAGASVVVFGLLIAYDNIIRTKENGLRVISLFIFALGVVAVYVSGTRSAWIGLGLGLLLLSFSNLLKGTVPMLVMLVASTILPPVFFARTETVVAALNGNYMDSSLVSRVNRWNWSIGIIRSNPLWGIGYGHWLSHNIFLEIGSTIGLIPAVLFLIFILQLVFHIIRVALNGPTPDARRYGWLFLAFALNWIVELNVETVFQTPPLAVAFWPIFALSWYLPDLFPKFPKKDA